VKVITLRTAQFDGLECRDLLNAGHAGYHHGFAALHLGLQAARDGKDGRGHNTLARFGMPRGGKLAVAEVALMVTVREPGCDIPQVSLADRLTAYSPKDCERGVLPLTKTNFIWRPLTYESELISRICRSD
jgi:hypothetical protein